MEDHHAPPKVSIIVLNWNGLEDTIECLESLKEITYSNYEVVVVDNGSSGNDADTLEEKYGGTTKLIRNEDNLGFTGGNNIAIEWLLGISESNYFLLLNNDTVVNPAFLTEMVRTMQEDPSIGITGSKVYFYDSPDVFQTVGCEIDLFRGLTDFIGYRQKDKGQFDQQQDVGYICGCCLLVTRQVVEKIGLLDDEYFAYYEDSDYCLRASRAGFRIVYVPSAKIWHKAAVSTASMGAYYYSARNNFIFMRKHATKRQLCSFLLYLFGYRLWFISAVCILCHRNMRQLTAFFRGVKDGMFYFTNSATESPTHKTM